MSPALPRRQLALAVIALLAVVLALALAPLRGGDGEEEAIPQPVGNWYEATAGIYHFDPATRHTACGYDATPATLGVAHPVLPCGTKIVIEYEDRQVLTQVIDRGTGAARRVFDLTPPLAARLRLRGIQPVRWAYVR